MFCYQLNVATTFLMDPPTVLTQYEREATDDDMPLVTICPTNQTPDDLNEKFKYDSLNEILKGDTVCDDGEKCYSWGAHLDLTFDELISQVFGLERVQQIFQYRGRNVEDEVVFIPGYGMCKELSYFNVTQELQLINKNGDDARVFLSDKTYRSYFMPDTKSHDGPEIMIKPGKYQYIDVEIQEKSDCTTESATPMTQNEFKKCVDDKIQKEFEEHNITCIPPWLSENRQCNQTYSRKFYPYHFSKIFNKDYKDMVDILSNTKVEKECRQSCKEKKYVVKEKGAKPYSSAGFADLTFDQKVVVTEIVPNYGMFKYIIDVGSSLGLWLGLSVLGLHDLLVWAVQLITNNSNIKKIKSVVPK